MPHFLPRRRLPKMKAVHTNGGDSLTVAAENKAPAPLLVGDLAQQLPRPHIPELDGRMDADHGQRFPVRRESSIEEVAILPRPIEPADGLAFLQVPDPEEAKTALGSEQLAVGRQGQLAGAVGLSFEAAGQFPR